MCRGGRASFDVIRAHINVRGVITRAIGRRESDSSPIISLEKFWPATMPLNMRIVEPELPQSSEIVGADKAIPRP